MPFTYNIQGSASQSTGVFTGLAGGTYDVFITDALGCGEFTTVILNEPPAFQIASTISTISCEGDSDGSITTVATGGTGTLSYLWSNNGTNHAISGLSLRGQTSQTNN